MTSILFTKSLCVLLAVGVVAAHPFLGADPNTLQCDPRGQVFLLLPHYTDCGKYFVCDHGREVEMPCPATTIFDFALQTCNHEWATTCQLRDRGDEIEGSGDDGDSRASFSAHSSHAEQVAEVQKAAMTVNLLDCDRSESASRQLPYRGDCQRYWRCSGRTLEAVYCSDGLFFNPESRQCDFEANVKCDAVMADELAGEFIVYK
ncbi:hypothetical protein ABMA27_011092 [Loxostege sticticalis]|uniref:Chitin-binding type-2 domain-containing protein n=1 Tax=Loxostege sticticalis TaxID=481309 RepID=A0ABR3H398_LOXSC